MATAADIKAKLDQVTSVYKLGTPTRKSKNAKRNAKRNAAIKAAGPPKSQQAAAGRKAAARRAATPRQKLFAAAMAAGKRGSAANPYKATAVGGKGKSTRSTEARLG